MLSIQVTAGNSMFSDIERAMKSMEDELIVHDEAKASRGPNHRRRSFWIVDEGE